MTIRNMRHDYYIPRIKLDTIIVDFHIAVKHKEVFGYYASVYYDYLDGILMFRKEKFLSINDSAYSMTLNLVADIIFNGKVKIKSTVEYEYCTLIKLDKDSKINYIDYVYRLPLIYLHNRKIIPFNMVNYKGYLMYPDKIEAAFNNSVLIKLDDAMKYAKMCNTCFVLKELN